MEFKKPTNKTLIIIAAFVVTFILYGIGQRYFADRGLKNDINDREDTIEQINEDKEPILQEIRDESEEIKKRDAVILALSNKQKQLLRTIKNLKNENDRIKDIYINNPIDERIELFARLATEQDSTQ